MPYKTGNWGEQAKERNKKRLEYFRKYSLVRTGHLESYISIGYMGEQEALIILEGSKKLSRKIDLEWFGKLVDVKTSSFHNKLYWKGWKFWLEKQRGLCDFFLLICKNMDGGNSHLFLIPEKEISKNCIMISINKLNLFEKYRLKVR